MNKLFLITISLILLIACNHFSDNTITSCVDLADKIKTLPITTKNILSPLNIDQPTDLKTLEIHEITISNPNKASSKNIDGKIINCKGKAILSSGKYPLDFYLLFEGEYKYVVVESQGKRKWIFQWKLN